MNKIAKIKFNFKLQKSPINLIRLIQPSLYLYRLNFKHTSNLKNFLNFLVFLPTFTS